MQATTQSALIDLARTRLHWREEFASGDALVDEQHKAMFTLVNRMLTASDAGEIAVALEHLDELVTLTMEHFRYEEEFLRQCGYHGLHEHQREHLTLLERTLTYRHDVAKGAAPLGELVQFLIDEVITKHLLETDGLYFHSLNAGRIHAEPAPTTRRDAATGHP